MPSPEQVRAAVDAYIDAYQQDDREAFLNAFADDGVVIDPVGMPPNAGREARGAFWDMVHGMAGSIRFEVRHVHVCGSEAAMVFEIHARTGEGAGESGMIIDAVDIFEVDDDGRITQVKAYWEMDKARPA